MHRIFQNGIITAISGSIRWNLCRVSLPSRISRSVFGASLLIFVGIVFANCDQLPLHLRALQISVAGSNYFMSDRILDTDVFGQ